MKQFIIVCGEYASQTDNISETLADSVKTCSLITMETILPFILNESSVSPEALYGIVCALAKIELELYNCVFFSYKNCDSNMRKFLIDFLKNTFRNIKIDCLYVKNINTPIIKQIEYLVVKENGIENKEFFNSISIPKKTEGLNSIFIVSINPYNQTFTLKETNE